MFEARTRGHWVVLATAEALARLIAEVLSSVIRSRVFLQALRDRVLFVIGKKCAHERREILQCRVAARSQCQMGRAFSIAGIGRGRVGWGIVAIEAVERAVAENEVRGEGLDPQRIVDLAVIEEWWHYRY